jgi:ribonuclease P protein component
VIAKKNVRLSVQRNRVKRNVRETFRHNQANLKGIDVIVLARRGLDQLDNAQMQEICNQLWLQLEKRAEKRFRQREG